MSSDSDSQPTAGDPVESITRGAVKGTLDWTEEKIKDLAKRFLNRKLVFIEDNETIKVAKEQRKFSEWKTFCEHVKDPDIRILFQMGLTLRSLEKQKQNKKIRELEQRVFKKYKTKGLHIAHLVHNGIFNKYIGNRMDKDVTPEELRADIQDLFFKTDEIVSFIDKKICIECDGEIWHNKKKDNFRDYMLKRSGWRTIRFTDYAIKKNVILCVDKIVSLFSE